MKKFLITMAAIGLSLMSFAQSGRGFIREKIERVGECKSVAITENNGDLMLYGRNNFYTNNCPRSLRDKLDMLRDRDSRIDDVTLTNNGSWLVLYDRNGYASEGAPSDMRDKLAEFNNDGEAILSATFNDNGDWIVISDEHYAASSSRLKEWIEEGIDEFGMIYEACITDDALVAVFKGGYKYKGDYPDGLRSELRNTDLDVRRLKIAGSCCWFFADRDGRNNYKM